MSLVGEALAVCAERLGDDATGVLARLGGALGEHARTAARDLAALDESARKRRRAEIAAVARTPIPPGLRSVHPTWIEAALAELPSRGRTALTTINDAVDVWLARWATASLPPLSTTNSSDLDRALSLDPAALATWIATTGTRALSSQLAEDPIARIQLTRRLPYDVGSVVEQSLITD